jgi:CHAT domain-containing protein/tetratricopeptide (TPR) repeat protein
VRIRVVVKAASVVALVIATLIGWWSYAFFGHHRVIAQNRRVGFKDVRDILVSTNAPLILDTADHFYWLNNGPAAAPLYARAEKLFSDNGEKRNEVHAHIGRLRSEAETMSFGDLSRYLAEQLQTPLLRNDKDLRLWCLIAKGYTDIEIDYRATKRDWLEARQIAKSLGHDQWVTRANGELGLVAFLEGSPGRAARLMGGALLSTMASGDVGGQIRFLELLGRGFEEVNRHGEAIRFFDRAIKLADGEKDSGLPFMAYEGKARALVATGKPNEARGVIQDALAKARAQQKRGHEAELLIILGTLAESTGDRTDAIQYLEQAGQFATAVQFYRMEADAMFELAKLYRDDGDLATANTRATQGLAASQRVGDRYYVPRNLTMLADLNARQGRRAEANALYEQAEDVIEGMLISVDEPYWNSSVAASMSQTYLQHFELAARQGDVPGAFRVLERVRGRTLAWALEDKTAVPISESDQTTSLEAEVANTQTRLMQSNNPDERERLLDQLTEDERRLSLTWTRGDIGSERLPVQPASLASVEHDLAPGEALFEYVLDEPNSFCLSIDNSGAHLEQLPIGRKEVEKLTRAYIADIRQKRDALDTSKQLFDSLLKPVPQAAKATRLVIVPDGALNLLPFDALQSDDGQFLIRSHEISYIPSGTILTTLRRLENQPPAPRLALAVGDVVYENQGDVGRSVPKPASLAARVERGIADLSGISLHDLPQTREEVEDIGRIVGHDSVVLLGKDATEAAFKKEPLDQFRILHLAVHGFADTQYPERSALVLGKDPSSTDDGLLQVREIIRLKLNADLATLSACDTGVGKLQGEEGISNLVEAFLLAGARSVVASLWSADDTSASALMEHFYQRLAAGESVSSALRNAKLDMLTKFGNDLNPYYWAAFISVGETSTPIGITK